MNDLTFVAILGGTLLACTPEQPAQDASSVAPDGALGRDGGAASVEDGENARAGVIDAKLAKLCELPTPYFGFDSTAIDADGAANLDALVTCFTTGPAKGKGLSIVGHADPRGTDTYNLGLGHRRAGMVEAHLKAKGMPVDKMETSSRGELDAEGRDEATWSKDRRVELRLAE